MSVYLLFMDPQQYCQEKAIKSGSSFYYSFLCLPKPQKQAMIALYAYCREVDDVVDEIPEKQIAQQKLVWWQHETKRLFQGTPQHPVTKALAMHREQFVWPNHLFEDLLRGMTMDLQEKTFDTFEALEDYCYCVAGTVGLMSTYVFGYKDKQTLEYAKYLGTSLQLINIIRDLGEDLRRGRLYLPLEDLHRFNLDPQRLMAFDCTQKDLQPLLAFEATRAREYYDKALQALPKNDRAQQKAGLVMAQIYLSLLKTIENEHFDVLHQKIKLTPIRKLWVAWRTLKREKKLSR